MNKRTIEEMISYFNQEVSNMDIAREYKMALLGMITAIGYETKKQEVVRCKECKWWDRKENSNYGYCHACKHGHYSKHWEIQIYRTYKDDFFCADGERRDDWIRNPKYPHGELRDHLIDEMIDKEERNGIQ